MNKTMHQPRFARFLALTTSLILVTLLLKTTETKGQVRTSDTQANRAIQHLTQNQTGSLLHGANHGNEGLFRDSDLGIKKYGYSDGLTATTLYGVLVSPDGYLWVYSNIGLYRYDGYNFESVPALAGKEVILTYPLTDTTIVALSFDNSIDIINTRLTSDVYRVHLPDSLQLTTFATFVMSEADTMYIGTSDGRVLRRKSGVWSELTSAEAAHRPTRITMIQRAGSRLVVTSVGKVLEIIGDQLHLIDPVANPYSKPSFQNGVWIAGSSHIKRLTPDGLENHASHLNLGIESILTQALVVSESELWIGSQGSGVVIREQPSPAEPVRVSTLFPGEVITGLDRDSSGTIWVSTLNNGLYRIEPWHRFFQTVESINNTPLQQVVFSDSHPIYGDIVVTRFNGGFFRLPGRLNWEQFTDQRVEYADWVDENRLFLSYVTTFSIFDFARQQTLEQEQFDPDHAIGSPVKDIAVWGDNLAIAGTNGSFVISLQNGGIKHSFPGRSTSVAFANSDQLVVGRPSRISLFNLETESESWTSPVPVNALLGVSDGQVLVGTMSKGLKLLDTFDLKLIPLTSRNGHSNNSWTYLNRLDAHHIVTAGSYGLFIAAFEEGNFRNMPEFTEIPLGTGGLGQTVRSVKSTGEYLWVSTATNIIRIPIESVMQIDLTPRLHIQRFWSDETELIASRHLDLPKNVVNLRIDLARSGYRNNERYVLEFSQDPDQESWSPLSQPQIQIAGLAPGSSRFSIRKTDRLSGKVISEVSVDVYKTPNWWQTTLGILAIGLGLTFAGGLGGFFLVRIFQRRRIRSYEQADRMRQLERVAVNHLLTSHYLFNALTTIRSLTRRSTDAAVDYIGNFARVIRALVDRSMNFDASLEEELEWINDYLALESVNRGLTLQYELQISEDLESDGIAIPSFTLQPVFENALNYGVDESGNISILCEVEARNQELIITIQNSLPVDFGNTTEKQVDDVVASASNGKATGVSRDSSDEFHSDEELAARTEPQRSAQAVDQAGGISGFESTTEPGERKKTSAGLKLLHDRLRNWVAFRSGQAHHDNILVSGASSSGNVWITTIRLPLIEL